MKELTQGVVEGVGRQARLDRPTFDPELRAGLAIVGGMFPPTVTSDLIDFMRVSYAGPPLETLIGSWASFLLLGRSFYGNPLQPKTVARYVRDVGVGLDNLLSVESILTMY